MTGAAPQDMLGTLGRGDILLADRAYDSDALRQDLAARGAWANVKPMPNRTNCRPSANSSIESATSSNASSTNSSTSEPSPPATTRRDDNYLAGVKLASARIWMRFNELVA